MHNLIKSVENELQKIENLKDDELLLWQKEILVK